MTTRTERAAVGAVAAAFAVVLAAGSAAAHISPDKSEVPAGGFTSLTFTVPHGCEESPTTTLAFQVPEGILNAAPQVHPGWDIEVEQEALAEPVEGSHGEEITERPGVITFTAQEGNALSPHFRDTFTIGFQAPDAAGETLFWPIIQTCEEGETAWIEEWDGEGEEPEHPAPSVAVVAASGDGHGASDGGDDDDGEVTPVDTEAAASVSDDDGGSDGLAIAALVVGALGVVVGGLALTRTRSS
jgi:uncharacterized protein YcnI